jgi:hypothetical protein
MRIHAKYLLIGIVLGLTLVVGASVLAQTSGSYNLEWNVIGNGGGESDSASYQVHGTVGQGITSQPDMTSNNFTVSSGYWTVDPSKTLYLPVLIE